MPIVFNTPETKETRRLLRNTFTEPENRLWYFLRDRRLSGIKFRRQYAIGRYIIDFYCPKARLAIEIDGQSHYTPEAQRYDAIRTEYLEACTIRVLRFSNDDIMNNIEPVLRTIKDTTTSPPEPSEVQAPSP